MGNCGSTGKHLAMDRHSLIRIDLNDRPWPCLPDGFISRTGISNARFCGLQVHNRSLHTMHYDDTRTSLFCFVQLICEKCLICRVAENSADNLMNSSNLSTLFGPVLLASETVSLYTSWSMATTFFSYFVSLSSVYTNWLFRQVDIQDFVPINSAKSLRLESEHFIFRNIRK